MKRLSMLSPLVVLFVALVVPVTAQQKIASGAKVKVTGTILKQEDQGFRMKDQAGSEWTVRLASNAKIEEKKGNPFRGSKKYTSAQLVRGLYVEVEGHGDSGNLIADKIKFSEDSLHVATSVNSTVVPVENRLGEAETRVTATEENAKRLSGQLDELAQVANVAKGGAAAAQETADAAVEGVNRTNDRISSLDDFDVKKSETINFKVGSWMLSKEAKAQLDEIASQAKLEKGFMIEVRGFASSDGSENSNRILSQKRSEAVMHYLADQGIPLRRIVLPYGYGEAMPVADNSTRDGRKQNRRAEVSILVSKGLTNSVNVNRASKQE
ncbi:MAG TPA: OmpA family protein [Blastocatellia bacterium]|jgi:outer membrane protein OmpA-like peptidoglycan-associated protein